MKGKANLLLAITLMTAAAAEALGPGANTTTLGGGAGSLIRQFGYKAFSQRCPAEITRLLRLTGISPLSTLRECF